MKKITIVLAIIFVGIATALTYHIFENVVHVGINYIWYDWFDTDNNRILVIPLAIVLSLFFFGLQHLLDPKSEKAQEHGLGNMPAPTMSNYTKVLLLGFFSLVAGASLGPEAILVPASMILGALVGARISKEQRIIKLLTAAAITALFTGFFHSFLIGVLSVLLVTKQAKIKLNWVLFVTAVISCAAAYLTLRVVGGESYAQLPQYSWSISVSTLFCSLLRVAAGYVLALATGYISEFAKKVHSITYKKSWWLNALVAAVVISCLYLLGGPLVEFTGNRSIIPMFNDAQALGLGGLLWVLIVKVSAIAWSKAIGYRGGMIFPTIFLASVLTAVVQLYVHQFNIIYGMLAVLVGAFIANSKTHILV